MPVGIRAGQAERLGRGAAQFVLTFSSYRGLTTVVVGNTDPELRELGSHLRAVVAARVPASLTATAGGRSGSWFSLDPERTLEYLDGRLTAPS